MNPAAPSPSADVMWTADPMEALRRIEALGGSAAYIARECLRRQPAPAAAVGGDEDSPTVSVDLWEAYKAWPEDIRQKLSMHDLRRMGGWKPPLGNTFRDGVAEQWLKSKTTPAAPVGGFVVVPMEATGDMRQAFNCQPRAIFTDAAYYAMLQAAPTAQPSANQSFDALYDAADESNQATKGVCRYWFNVGSTVSDISHLTDDAQSSAKDGVRGDSRFDPAEMRVVADDLDKLGIDGWLCAQIGAAFIRHVITPVEPKATTAAGLVDGNHKLDTDTHVFFYEQDFYVLSNFSAFSLQWEGFRFETSEAAYHYEKFKFHDPEICTSILFAPSAHEAFKIADRNKHLRDPDWDNVKLTVMRAILRAKADQHEYVRRKLLATGDRILVEDSWRDDYWGWGPNRDGQNMLGKLWMEVRDNLRREAAIGREVGK